MDKNLESYVKVYKGLIDKKECTKAIKELKTKKWQQHTFYSPKNDEDVNQSGSRELDVTEDVPSNHDYMMQKVWESLHQYVTKDMNFTWWNGWHGFSSIRYNMYKKNRVMAEHCDHIHSLFGRGGVPTGIPVLTILAGLNDNYEGGEFIMWQDTEFRLGTGDVMVFPSNFLFPHRVEEVTKGTRYSFVSWSW
jgi:predicted 2-oxoglutarate/Fe(II)-dependent dioxygenase YbiX